MDRSEALEHITSAILAKGDGPNAGDADDARAIMALVGGALDDLRRLADAADRLAEAAEVSNALGIAGTIEASGEGVPKMVDAAVTSALKAMKAIAERQARRAAN